MVLLLFSAGCAASITSPSRRGRLAVATMRSRTWPTLLDTHNFAAELRLCAIALRSTSERGVRVRASIGTVSGRSCRLGGRQGQRQIIVIVVIVIVVVVIVVRLAAAHYRRRHRQGQSCHLTTRHSTRDAGRCMP